MNLQKSILSSRLHRMHESGLMNKWITEQIPTKDKCSDISAIQSVNERKVNVTDMQGIFFVLFMGNVFFFFFFCSSQTPHTLREIL